MRNRLLLTVVLGLASGCGVSRDRLEGFGALDGGALDGGALDGGALDGGALDGGALDGGALDGGVLDGGVLDGGVLDGGVLDGGALDGGVLDGGASTDAGAPGADLQGPDVGTLEACAPLEARCHGTCAAVFRDPANCGDCDVACPVVAGATATCLGGRCGHACAAGRADCDSSRANGCETDTTADHDNCGACGRSCGALGECVDGDCTPCPAARPHWCGGSGCTNTREDAANCRGCGVVCPVGAVCNGRCLYARCDDGVPRGVGTWLLCGERCVNFDGDATNCGGCGRACPSTAPVCTAAGCVPR